MQFQFIDQELLKKLTPDKIHLIEMEIAQATFDGYDSGLKDGKQDCPCDNNYNPDDIFKSGYKQGHHDGYEEGFADGKDVGYDNGYDNGYSDGYEEGYNGGYDDGYDRGWYDGQDECQP